MLPLAVSVISDSVPTLVILGCAAVVKLPATVVNTPAVAPILPTLAFPVALIVPPVTKFPAVTLPVAVINPPVPILYCCYATLPKP